MYQLKIISSTVRPGRKGPIVTNWIAEKARNDGNFNLEVLDLKAMNLPLMDEPLHPRFKKYEQEHTKQWSAKIEEADAFIFVTAEYDHNYPAPLRNALEFLYSEWGYKAAGIVSYGGVSAGTRAAKSLSGDLTTFRIVPLVEAVNIPFFTEFIKDGKLVPNEIMDKAADTLLRELARWTRGMKAIREDK
ncbi:MAG: NADPH-dependent FMN reductase [Anditalea sp.]